MKLWLIPLILLFIPFTVQAQLSNLKADDFFISLEKNYADLTFAYSIYTVKNPTQNDIILTPDILKLNIIDYKGSETQRYELFYLDDVCHIENYKQFLSYDCPVDYDPYKPETWTCKENTKDASKEICVNEWKPLINFVLKPTESIKIKSVVHYKAELGFQSRDWIPKITLSSTDYIKNEWAWYNVSFNETASISLSDATPNQSMTFYMSDIGNFIRNESRQDCADIRVTATDNATLLDYFIDICNRTDARVGFLHTGGVDIQAYVWWGYADAEPQNKTMRVGFVDFNDVKETYNVMNITNADTCAWVLADGVLNQTSTSCYPQAPTQNFHPFFNSSIAQIYNGTIIGKLRIYSGTSNNYYFGLGGHIGSPNGVMNGYIAQTMYNDFAKMVILDEGVAWKTANTYAWDKLTWHYMKFKINSTGQYAKAWGDNVTEPNYLEGWIINASQTGKVNNNIWGLGGLGGNPSVQGAFDDVELWVLGYEPKIYTGGGSGILLSAKEGFETNEVPTYDLFNASAQNVSINTNVIFYSRWSDENLSKYIFSWNGSYCNGTWNNETASNFLSGNFTNTTKQVTNSSCENLYVGYRFYANDSANQFNVTSIGLLGIIPTPTVTYANTSTTVDISSFMTSYCIDNQTLKWNASTNNETTEIIQNCLYGCDSKLNICYPNPTYAFLIGIGAFVIIVVLIRWAWRKL